MELEIGGVASSVWGVDDEQDETEEGVNDGVDVCECEPRWWPCEPDEALGGNLAVED